MNEEQIAELKALVDELEAQGLSTADIQTKVDERKATFVEGKTSGVAETGATVTPETGPAPEITESESVDISLDSQSKRKGRAQTRQKELEKRQQPTDLESQQAYEDAIAFNQVDLDFLNNPIDFTPKGVGRELQPYDPQTNEDLINTVFDPRWKNPTTGEYVEEFDLVYRPDYDEAGNLMEIVQPYEQELFDAKNMLIENGVEEPNNEQIRKLAERNIKDKYRYDTKKRKSTEYLDSISNEEREKLVPYKVDEYIKLDKKLTSATDQYQTIFNSYKDSPNSVNLINISARFDDPDYKFDLSGLRSAKDADVYLQRINDLGDPENLPTQASVDLYNNLVAKYKDAIENAETVVLSTGKEVPKATFNLYKDLVEENQEVSSVLAGLEKEINEIPVELSEAEVELDFLKKNYSTLQKAGANIQLQMGSIPYKLLGGITRIATDGAEIAMNKIFGVDEDVVEAVIRSNPLAINPYAVTDFTTDIVEKAEDMYRKKYKDDVAFDDAFNSWENFGEYALQQTAGQAGTFTMLAAGLYPGMIGIGASSYDDQRRLLDKEEELLGTEQSTHYKAAVSLGFASAEVGLGFAPTFFALKRGFNAADLIGKRSLINEGFKTHFKKQFTRAGVDGAIVEPLSEGGTVFVQNAIDIGRGKEGVGLFDNVPQGMFDGAFIGTGLNSVPVIKGMVLSNLSDYNSFESYRKNLEEMAELNETGLTLDKRTKEYKVIQQQIADLNEANNEIIKQVEEKVAANLTTEGFDLYARATSEQEQLRLEAKEILESNKLSDAQKKPILTVLHAKFSALQLARNEFRKDYKINIDLLPKVERDKYIDRAKVELEKEGVEFTNLQLKQRAEKLWQIDTFDANVEQSLKANQVLSEAGVDQNSVVAETKAEAIDAFSSMLDARLADPNSGLTEEDAKKELARFTKNVNSGSANGVNLSLRNTETGKTTYDIVIVKENAIANGKTGTNIHEIGHTLFTEGLSSNPGDFTDLAGTVMNYLEKSNPSAYRRIKRRTRGQDADEVLTNFLEEVSSGRLDLEAEQNKGLLSFLSFGINNSIKNATDNQTSFNLTGETDVVDFLTSLGTKLKEGTLSVTDVQQIQEGKPVKETKPEAAQDVELRAAASLTPENSAKVNQIYAEQGIAGYEDILNLLKPTAKGLARRFENRPDYDEQLVTDAILTGKRGMLDVIMDYNKKVEAGEQVPPLSGFINKSFSTKTGFKRYIDAAEEVVGTEFTEDVTEARGVAAEEATIEVAKQPRGPRKPTETTVFSDTALANLGVNKAEAEQQISDATKKSFKGQVVTGFGQTRNVPVKVAEIYGKMFGVNPETIYDKKRNYSKKDAEGLTRIKQYLIDNATSDFARLPKLKDDFGKATFIPNNVMNALYTDGKLTGTLKDYLNLIREKPVKPIYRDRVGQTIRGLFNTSIRNRMLEDLITSKPERIRAGAKFSLTPEQTSILEDVSVARNINTVLDLLGLDSASVNDENRAEIQEDFLEAVKKYGLTPNDILAGAFTSSGAVRVQVGRTKNGKLVPEAKKLDEYLKSQNIQGKKGEYWYALDNGNWVKSKRKVLATGKLGKSFVPPTGVTNLLPQRGRLYYGNTDPKYVEALEAAEANLKGKKQPEAKRVSVEKANTEDGIAQAEINMQVLDNVVKRLDKAVKAGMPKSLAAMIIVQGYQATSGLIKIAAPFKYRSLTEKYAPKGAKSEQRTGAKFREEHNPPASVIGASIIFALSNGTTNIVMPAIKSNYYQTRLSKADDYKLDLAKLDATLPQGYTILQNPAIRFVKAGIDLNSIINYDTGKSLAEELGVKLDKSKINADSVAKQNQLVADVIDGKRTPKNAQKYLDEYTKLDQKVKVSYSNTKKLPASIRLEDPSTFDSFGMVDILARQMFPDQANSDAVKSGRITAYEALDPEQQLKVAENVPGTPVEKTIAIMKMSDTAIDNARDADAESKGISVWDFDDTLATTKSNVLYTMPDGTEGVLNAEQFAKRGDELLQQGAEFDFSEFEKVTEGGKGPMFEKAVARNRKFGNDNVYILTARTQAAAEPIHQFLKAIGLDIPLKNIVGLGNSTPEAKATWVVSKAAEGYNDFYFADDAYKNVKAVRNALSVLDVKSKVRQAYVKYSNSEALDKGFNDILEQTTGIASEKEYKKVKAEVAGASIGRVFRGIPYSAQDFVGLLYETLGKGKLGDAQMAWYKEHLIKPYARAVNDIDNARLAVMADYRALKKQLGFVPKNLRKKLPGEPFTREQAVRVYIWNKLGYDVPGISKQDLKELSEYVADNADLQVFADQVIAIQKGEYAKPKEGWPAGTITTDIQESINTGVRAKYLQQWQNNVDVIFSEKNMNKLEAAYGKKYRVAMENMLERMKTGRNRRFSDDSLTGRFTDWLQGSIGAIMFFNSRSALLQNLSSINFLNFTDNNPLAAARAFANQKQYWSDFMTLINSDFLKARRSGLRMNVNEADIADMAKKGGPRAVISKLLQFGFTPTQVADSFAIASGGATFYRNRIKSLMKQGMSQAEAETQAFEDFRETAEESQQSARPDRISMQQAGPLGRLILAFQNTPSQYARIIDKSIRDLKNGRGDRKTNISKIIYYSTVQNLMFNALQQALFAMAFDDEEPTDKEKKDKYVDIVNSMADSLLRGTGVAGGVLSVTKNAIIRIIEESQKKNPNYEKVGADLQRIAPPISSKLSKINQAARSFKWDKDQMINGGWGLDNPAYLAVGNVVSATTNIPMDRGVKKINNLIKASDSELETWERLALLGGWQDWELGIEDEKQKKKKSKATRTRKPKKRKQIIR